MMTAPMPPSGLRQQKRRTTPTEWGQRHGRVGASETVIVWIESATAQYRMRGSTTAYSRSTPRLATTMIVTTRRLIPWITG